MLGAFAKGGLAATIATAVEIFLLATNSLVVSPELDLTNANLWKAPVWALVVVPVLAFGFLFFTNIPHRNSGTD